jgi:serine phosphatase RsbU (regulator of sigma subunit)/HAMP domain-containing protein
MKQPVKKYKFSLRLKITLLFLLLVIVMMATVGYIFTIRELNLRKEQMALGMERLANNIATIRSVETGDWDVYQTYIDNQIVVNPDIVYIAIFDDQGRLKVHALNRAWLDLGSDRPLSRLEQGNIVLRLDQRQIAAESLRDFASKSVNIMVGPENLGTVNIGFSLVDLNDEMKKNLNRNLLLDIIFILLAVVVAFFAGSAIVNPLGRLTLAMEKITQGDLDQELHISSRDEIGEMATTFNYMARGLQEKQIIETFSHELGFTFELARIAQLMTRHITTALEARQSLLLLNHKEDPSRFILIGAHPAVPQTDLSLQLDEQNVRLLLSERRSLPLTALAEEAGFLAPLRELHGVRDEGLITPLVVKDTLRGLFLICCPQNSSRYAPEEMQLLDTLLSQGNIAIENALLYEELTEQERLKKELEIARRVQLSLLPQTTLEVPGLDIDGVCLPAEEIGGDYYDYFRIDDHTIGIAIADVTGKGTSAAFYMAVIKGIMLSLTTIHTSPKALLRELNQRVLGTMERRIFATMIYATIDTRKRLLTFARAGHNALIRRSAGDSRVESLTPKGMGLGLAQDGHFEQHISEERVRYQPGDLFVFYTDGISEAMNDQRQEFSEESLLDFIADLDDQNARDVNQKIVRQVHAHTRNTPPHDDITLVTVKAV